MVAQKCKRNRSLTSPSLCPTLVQAQLLTFDYRMCSDARNHGGSKTAICLAPPIHQSLTYHFTHVILMNRCMLEKQVLLLSPFHR